MQIKDLKNLIKDLPPEMEIAIVNPSYEWYGIESMDNRAWKVENEILTYSFVNDELSQYDLAQLKILVREEF